MKIGNRIMKIGIVGTSGWKHIDKKEIQKIITEIFDELPKIANIEIIGGGGVVPVSAFKEARKRHYACLCIAPKCVSFTPKGVKE